LRGIEKFESAETSRKGDIRRVSSTSSRRRVDVAVREQYLLLLEDGAGLGLQAPAIYIAGLVGSFAHRYQLRLGLVEEVRSVQRFLVKRSLRVR